MLLVTGGLRFVSFGPDHRHVQGFRIRLASVAGWGGWGRSSSMTGGFELGCAVACTTGNRQEPG